MRAEANVRGLVDRMVEAYERQREAYEQILHLARCGGRLVAQGRPLAEVHRVNLQKRRWLGVIDEIETELVVDKERWRASDRPAVEAARLDAMLQRLRDLIEAILEAERDTDLRLTEATGEEVSAC